MFSRVFLWFSMVFSGIKLNSPADLMYSAEPEGPEMV